ncbi:MAG: hypothetical protein EAZ78_20180 [Oscillatoriales cyanobacterium]|uniref:hypothetical protein n=1 Tax=Microcoleus anatoxicus TaxID=2705319 RepID=UPI0029795748|nr:MAG: hypothetical protein EA000_16840 [Oscillatoriales cyanobacterium]TAF00494.1 MAG: hypothetical protein EAZ78_20180 [Oscillatoriales cyanobacterium]TAF33693.1 MAG: hypothetical protein EAZ68_19785 [Oscillatoriales cyanobacterium]TAF70394.1 MAG: hypothetical protein EAZ59_04915 [Oscillatoriales cyanobacterium]
MKPNIRLPYLVALSIMAVGVSPSPSNANPSPQGEFDEITVVSNNIELNRAKNLARQAAEVANGGLGEYRAEPSMHGVSAEAPFVDNGDGTWTFSFKGSRPGSSVYRIESVVTVSRNGLVRIDYNGLIRNSNQI